MAPTQNNNSLISAFSHSLFFAGKRTRVNPEFEYWLKSKV